MTRNKARNASIAIADIISNQKTMSRAFYKQLIFISLGIAILVVGGLAIYSATPSGNLKIAGGYQQYGSGRPVAWWKMDEASWSTSTDASPVKDSIGTNNGTPYNHASTTATAVFGRAGSFDGVDDYVSGSGVNIASSPFTISAWVKANSFSSKQFFSIGTGENPRQAMHLRLTSATSFKFGLFFDDLDVTMVDMSNRWTHIVVTLDSSYTQKVYQDGKFINSRTAGGYFSGNTSWNIGRWVTYSNEYFNGLIDDIRIYNYDLTADQVRQIYNETAKIKMVNQENTTTTSNNPVGWWKMDEGTASSSYDSSGNGNTGTLYGGVQWATGKLGKGLSFDGVNDYVSVPYNANQLLTTGGTISAWVKLNPLSQEIYPYTFRQIVDNGNGTDGWTGYEFRFIGTNKLEGRIHTSDPYIYSAANAVSYNTWANVVMTFNSSGLITFYVNGNISGTPATSGSPTNITTNQPLKIGAGFGVGYPFNGLIDDVRIYNRALSAGEVAQMYNSTKDGYLGKIKVSTGLVGYWKLDDNNALTSVIDYSGKGNTGTAYSGTATSTSVLSTSTAMVGRAMSFDGVDDYVDGGQFNLTQATFSGWIKFNGYDSSYRPFISRSYAMGGYGWAIDMYSNYQLRMNVAKSDHSGMQQIAYTLTGLFNTTSWFYITSTISPAEMKLYINGALVATQSTTGGYDFNSYIGYGGNNILIGGQPVNAAYFNGLIDEVKIWNYARTAEQIYNDYVVGSKHREE